MNYRETFWKPIRCGVGVSLAEYSLILGLVVLASITTMILMGVTFQSFFSDVQNTLASIFQAETQDSGTLPIALADPGQDVVSAGNALHHVPLPSQALLGEPASLAVPGISPVHTSSPTRLNPVSVAIGNYPKDLDSLVETSGFDGAMRRYADVIEQMANDLATKGAITDAKRQRLLTLVAELRNMNLDALMAEAQRLRLFLKESNCQTIAGKFTCVQSPNRADGTLNTPGNAAYEEAAFKLNEIEKMLGSMSQQKQTQLKAFVQDPKQGTLPFTDTASIQYKVTKMLVDLNDDGTILDPSIKGVVGDVAYKMATLSGTMGNHLQSAEDLSLFTQQVVKDLEDTSASSLVSCTADGQVVHTGSVCVH
jgi:Flp pilus assembly pilin Flp